MGSDCGPEVFEGHFEEEVEGGGKNEAYNSEEEAGDP